MWLIVGYNRQINMTWCFALVNGRLAEIYFNKTKKDVRFLGHCYVEKSEYSAFSTDYTLQTKLIDLLSELP